MLKKKHTQTFSYSSEESTLAPECGDEIESGFVTFIISLNNKNKWVRRIILFSSCSFEGEKTYMKVSDYTKL
jgi:hypothetical protein